MLMSLKNCFKNTFRGIKVPTSSLLRDFKCSIKVLPKLRHATVLVLSVAAEKILKWNILKYAGELICLLK